MTSTPLGLKWRAGFWYVTFVVWLGITVDILVYSIIVPVIPFRLEQLGYDNVSSRVGWLLFSFTRLLATLPIATISERHDARKWPLVLGIFLLIGAIIMLMEAPVYWLMVIARFLQGVASTLVWVPGLALLCDTVSDKVIGRQMGVVMSGLSLGFLIGPPVGGALYDRFGFRGTCLFGVIAAIVDLIARLIVIERKYALKWGFDPQNPVNATTTEPSNDGSTPAPMEEMKQEGTSGSTNADTPQTEPTSDGSPKVHLSLAAVVLLLLKSPRAWTSILCILTAGMLATILEAPLPVHMNRVWNFDSRKVGLVFIASVVPSFVSTLLAGYLSDKFGAAPVVFAGLVLAIPFWVSITYNILVLFIVSFAVELFFISGAFAPLNAELAHVSQSTEGIGYAHVSGAFNIGWGVGSAVGPIIGGQIFDHVKNGWPTLCYIAIGLVTATAVVVFFGLGDETLLSKTKRFIDTRRPNIVPSSNVGS
ncbi:MFS general substrate transporter [Marasmius fiardii PR-910]|nr:MFS general substrate transporter [Marasmius fiardii PR-910]